MKYFRRFKKHEKTYLENAFKELKKEMQTKLDYLSFEKIELYFDHSSIIKNHTCLNLKDFLYLCKSQIHYESHFQNGINKNRPQKFYFLIQSEFYKNKKRMLLIFDFENLCFEIENYEKTINNLYHKIFGDCEYENRETVKTFY